MEGFVGGVELGSRVGPRVPIIGDHIAAVSDCTVVEEEVRFSYDILEADAHPDPSHKLNNFNPPSNLIITDFLY